MSAYAITARKQRGVAVVTALLLTTLAITIVASLFWQQQVQVRAIENQRLQTQREWIVRGASDWARVILRDDAARSPVTYLGAPWATPLAKTKLDDFVEGGTGDADAAEVTLEGYLEDAQARFNLAGLSQNAQVNPREVAAFARLLTILGLNPLISATTAELMRESQQGSVQETLGSDGAKGDQTPPPAKESARPLGITRVQDLLAVKGVSVEVLTKLQDYVIVLPRPTPVSANTASAEVLAARIDNLSIADANVLVAARKSAFFNNAGDMQNRLPGINFNPTELVFVSNFFLLYGDVRLGRAALQVQSLIERANGNATILWTREK